MTPLRAIAARVRLAVLCAALVVAGGAPPARAIDASVDAEVVLVGESPCAPVTSRAVTEATWPVRSRRWPPVVAPRRSTTQPSSTSTLPLYLSHHALLR